MMGPDLYELAAQTAGVAAANGFDPPTFDNLPTKIALVMTELCEAADAARDGTNLAEELADAVLRILGILHAVWGDDWAASRIDQRRPAVHGAAFNPIEVLLFPTFRRLCRAVESWRSAYHSDVKINLEMAMLELWRLADALNLNLDQAVQNKLEKNRKREHLHGKVRSEG